MSSVDLAYGLCSKLNAIVDKTAREAEANPTDRKWIALGITEAGQKPVDARRAIEQTFRSLSALVRHLTLLYIASEFEGSARAKLARHVGEGRGALRVKIKAGEMPIFSERLIRSPDDYESLALVSSLLEGHLAGEFKATLNRLRQDRNRFAHGTDIAVPPETDVEEALIATRAALSLI